MEYGSVKAATEAHPEIEYELRLPAQELEEHRKKALMTTPAGSMRAAV
jgi:hypothetical protein